MTGCCSPGSQVYLSYSSNPKRRLPYSWEAIRVGRVLVSVNTLLPNRLVKTALLAGALDDTLGIDNRSRCADTRVVQSEVRVDSATRLDLAYRCGNTDLLIELKNVTLVEGRRALFPDAVTARGQKHLQQLMKLRQVGRQTALMFFVARADADIMAPADGIDPEYGRLLRQAARSGVALIALQVRVRRRGVTLERTLPIALD